MDLLRNIEKLLKKELSQKVFPGFEPSPVSKKSVSNAKINPGKNKKYRKRRS